MTQYKLTIKLGTPLKYFGYTTNRFYRRSDLKGFGETKTFVMHPEFCE